MQTTVKQTTVKQWAAKRWAVVIFLLFHCSTVPLFHCYAATTITTRTGKGSTLTWTELDGNFTNLRDSVDNGIGLLEAQIAALTAGQAGGTFGFATKAEMDADLAHDANTLARVTNDSTASNNGIYIKLGASGAGSWQRATYQDQPFALGDWYGNDLAAAVSAIGSTPTTLLYANDMDLTSNISIPATLELMPINGAQINHTTYTIGYAGPVERWDLSQKFNGTGAVSLAGAHLVVYREWFPATYDFTTTLDAAIAAGPLHLGGGTFEHTGLDLAEYTEVSGVGKHRTILENTADTDSLSWAGSDGTRLQGLTLRDLQIKGNAGATGSGLRIDYSVRYGINPLVIDNCKITQHGEYGVHWTNGDSMHIQSNEISYNGLSGIYVYGTTNLAEIAFNDIHHNTENGVYINQVASNCTLIGNQINDNGSSGALLQRAEQSSVLYNAFNRNGSAVSTHPAVNIVGDGTKSCEAVSVIGNLFGDNNTTGYDVSAAYVYGLNIKDNYFFDTTGGTKSAYIRLSTGVLGAKIAGNRWTNVTVPKLSVIDSTVVYSFDDSGDITKTSTIIQNGVGQCVKSATLSTASGVLDLSAVKTSRIIVSALSENISSITFPTSPLDGQTIKLRFKQASSGGPYTVAGWPANVKLDGGAYTMTSTAGKVDVLTFEYSEAAAVWYEVNGRPVGM